jgi:chromosome segregation ATPase
MATDTLDAIKETTANLKNAVAALEAEESKLAGELATVKSKRQAVAKALAALEDTTPKKRRGRPRKDAAAQATEGATA